MYITALQMYKLITVYYHNSLVARSAILQVIKNWTVGRPSNEVTPTHNMAVLALQLETKTSCG